MTRLGRWQQSLILASAGLLLAGCGGAPPPGVSPKLSSALMGNCFGFPETPATPTNMAPWMTGVKTGALAVDFTLLDTEGASYSLSGLLADKPVWIQLGNYTCPIYQAANQALTTLTGRGDPKGRYTDQLHFVHVYTVEAHPKSPDVSAYRGEVWEQEFSTLREPTTYEERRANALVLKPSIAGDQLLLVDDLTPGSNNPVWCTYGTCPACSFLVGRDGRIREVIRRTPDSADELQAAADRLLR